MKKFGFMKTFCIIAILAVILINDVCITAQSQLIETETFLPCNIAITQASVELSRYDSETYYCEGVTRVTMGYIAGVKVELQKYTGERWRTIETWSKMNQQYALMEQLYELESGYSYRLKVTHYAYDDDDILIEEIIKYSDVVTV